MPPPSARWLPDRHARPARGSRAPSEHCAPAGCRRELPTPTHACRGGTSRAEPLVRAADGSQQVARHACSTLQTTDEAPCTLRAGTPRREDGDLAVAVHDHDGFALFGPPDVAAHVVAKLADADLDHAADGSQDTWPSQPRS